MKKTFLFGLLLISMSASAQTITVPDANFRNFLATTYNATISGNQVTFVSPAIADITTMDCSGQGIANLSGIENFTNLTDLNCSTNSLTSLNVSALSALQTLDCSQNSIASLNLSSNFALQSLICNNNSLTTLTVAPSNALQTINCANNLLTTFDISQCGQVAYLEVSGNSNLISLHCQNNQLATLLMLGCSSLDTVNCSNNQLTSLNLFSLPALRVLNCSNNQLTSLSPFANSQLKELRCSNNAIGALFLQNNPQLEIVHCDNNQITGTSNLQFATLSSQLRELVCKNNSISALDLFGQTALEILDCDNNQIPFINLSFCPNLKTLNCRSNGMVAIDVSNNPQLEALRASFNNISSINLANNPNLKDLRLASNNFSSPINVSNLSQLEIFTPGGNPVGSVNVSANPNLKELYCWQTNITTLDVSNNPNLEVLDCATNQLTSLNLANNPNLNTLNCSQNQLASLDISANGALQFVNCSENLLSNLTLNAVLFSLNCRNNQLTSLDVSNCSGLVELFCNDNQITGALNVSANSALSLLWCQGNRIPIVLTGTTPIPNLQIDAVTQVAVFRNDVQNPTIGAGETGAFVLGNAGAIVNFITNASGAASLNATTGANPNIVPPLPTGINVVSPDRFWTINQTGLSTFSYNLILDLTGINGIQNFNLLRVLKRDNNAQPWLNVAAPPINATVDYLEPFIIVSGLTSFSDFGIGSDANDNQLPVTLSAFSGRATAEGVALQWSTQSEQSNLGFAILRKEGDGEFFPIASYQTHRALRGRGTTATPADYAFLDDGVEAGKTYTYRLRSFDFDGTIHDYAPTVVVETRDAVQNRITKYALLQNYPNPFNPSTLIAYELPRASDVSLKVFDMLGREVATLVNERQERGRYAATFNASGLSSGMYFYRLQAGNFVQTKKMMLVK